LNTESPKSTTIPANNEDITGTPQNAREATTPQRGHFFRQRLSTTNQPHPMIPERQRRRAGSICAVDSHHTGVGLVTKNRLDGALQAAKTYRRTKSTEESIPGTSTHDTTTPTAATPHMGDDKNELNPVCTACTYENAKGARCCEMCETSLIMVTGNDGDVLTASPDSLSHDWRCHG